MLCVTQKEFERLQKTCETEKVKLPTKRQLEKKAAQLQKLGNQPMTEVHSHFLSLYITTVLTTSPLQSDIAAILQRKRDINASATKSGTSLTMERSRLQQARTLAFRRQDFAELAQIDTQLAELQASAATPAPSQDADVLAKVNERNRRLNQEQVRKAERAEMERRRREKLMRAAAGSGAATPTGGAGGGAMDAAARLRAKMLGAGTSRSVLAFFVGACEGGSLTNCLCWVALFAFVAMAMVRTRMRFTVVLQTCHARNTRRGRFDAALGLACRNPSEGRSEGQWEHELRGESAAECGDRSWRLLDERGKGPGLLPIMVFCWTRRLL